MQLVRLRRHDAGEGQFGILVGVATIVAAVIAILTYFSGAGPDNATTTTPISNPGTDPPSTEPATSTTGGKNVTTTMEAATSQPPSRPPVVARVFLADLDPTEGLNSSSGTANVNGEIYPQSVKLYSYSQAAGPVHVSFVIGRKYNRLKTVVGVDDEATDGHRLRLQIFADDAVIFQKDVGKGESYPVDAECFRCLQASNGGDQTHS